MNSKCVCGGDVFVSALRLVPEKDLLQQEEIKSCDNLGQYTN